MSVWNLRHLQLPNHNILGHQKPRTLGTCTPKCSELWVELTSGKTSSAGAHLPLGVEVESTGSAVIASAPEKTRRGMRNEAFG